MGREQQPQLPGFEKIEPASGKSKAPQPRIGRFRSPKWYEILHHPLDINFKGRLREWIERSEREENFSLEEILPDYHLELVNLYLSDSWPGQERVMAQMGENPNAPLKPSFTRAMIMIWRRIKNGPRAIEILKIEDNFTYRQITTYVVKDGEKIKRITTIDELAELSPDDLTKICGARPMFEKLKAKMQKFFPKWAPKLVFRQELSPEEA